MANKDEQKQPEILFDFGPPPRRRLDCPIVDAHTHVGDVEVARPLVEAARQYGITRAVGITRIKSIQPLRQAFGDYFDFAVSLNYENKDDPAQLQRDCRAILDEARDLGAVMVKFWFKPEFYASSGLTLDDDQMQPILDHVADLGFACVVHIADPDKWFETRYADAEKYRTKRDQYVQLEHVLERYPNMPVLGAHMGGDPEHLDHLRQLLDDYPNYCLDTSATKWVTRELGRQPEAARAFFIEYADRLLFGSDLVARKEPHPAHYSSRYWTMQRFFETDMQSDSPIHDPDADGPVCIVGLNLPDDVLERVYHRNAERILGIGAAPH